jgi:hypothetical protein
MITKPKGSERRIEVNSVLVAAAAYDDDSDAVA